MIDAHKTKDQLVDELRALRQQLRQEHDRRQYAEQALQAATERFRRVAEQGQLSWATRHDAVGALVAGIGHHFNDLLTVILC